MAVSSQDDTSKIFKLKKKMADQFEIKDLGNLKYFHGMEVARSREGIFVSLSHNKNYTLNLLKETSVTGCRPVDTPLLN